jgi:hypothetical protein
MSSSRLIVVVQSRHHVFVARELVPEDAEVHLVLDVDIRITSLKFKGRHD